MIFPGQRSEARNFYRSFDPNVRNPEVGRLGAIAGAAGQGNVQAAKRTLANTDHSNIGPRVGAAYSLNSRTVIRGGVGLYYSPIIYGFEGQNELQTGLIGYNTGSGARTPDGRNARFFLSSYPSIPPVAPNSQFIGSDVQFFNQNFRTGRTLQYSFDVQRELPHSFVVSVGYVGHHATRLRSNFERLNGLPLNALKLGFPILNMSLADALANPAIVTFAQTVGAPLPASTNSVYPVLAATWRRRSSRSHNTTALTTSSKVRERAITTRSRSNWTGALLRAFSSVPLTLSPSLLPMLPKTCLAAHRWAESCRIL